MSRKESKPLRTTEEEAARVLGLPSPTKEPMHEGQYELLASLQRGYTALTALVLDKAPASKEKDRALENLHTSYIWAREGVLNNPGAIPKPAPAAKSDKAPAAAATPAADPVLTPDPAADNGNKKDDAQSETVTS